MRRSPRRRRRDGRPRLGDRERAPSSPRSTAPRGAGTGRRAVARPRRRAADRPQPHLDRSARHPDPHRRGDRRARRRRGRAPLPAGPWRASARAGDRPLGLGLAAHRRRRSRAGAVRYLGVQPTWDKASSRVTGIEILPLADARPAAHRRDAAHLRPVPRHLRGADRAVRHGGARASRRSTRTTRGQSAGRGPARAATTSRASSAARRAATARRPPTIALDGALARPRRAGRGLSRRRHPRLWRRRVDGAAERGLPQPRLRGRRAGPSAGRPRARPSGRRRRRRFRRRLRRGGGAARQRARALPSRHQPDRERPRRGALAEEIARVVRGRLDQSALARRHAASTAIAASPRSPRASMRSMPSPRPPASCPAICSMRRTPR